VLRGHLHPGRWAEVERGVAAMLAAVSAPPGGRAPVVAVLARPGELAVVVRPDDATRTPQAELVVELPSLAP
jgi:hypothetical protein